MSATHSRFTVSVPSELLERAERVLRRPAEPRSALVQRLLEEALRAAEAQRQVEEYIRAYREVPAGDDEFEWTTAPEVLSHLDDLPWDDAAR